MHNLAPSERGWLAWKPEDSILFLILAKYSCKPMRNALSLASLCFIPIEKQKYFFVPKQTFGMGVVSDCRVPGGKGSLSSVDFKLCLWLPTTGAKCRWLFMQFLILRIKDVGIGNCEQTDACTPFRTAFTGYQEA